MNLVIKYDFFSIISTLGSILLFLVKSINETRCLSKYILQSSNIYECDFMLNKIGALSTILKILIGNSHLIFKS